MSASFRIRNHYRQSSPPGKSSTSQMKKIALTLLVLLSLFLAGTIVVLSTTKYYLNIPQYAYLTEDEVAWRQSDAIKPLLYEPEESLVLRRQEWDEITDVRPDGGPDGGVMGADMLPEVWEELEEVTAEIGDEVGTAQSGDETEVVWDVDGPGTGGYWMRKDWEGTVRGTDSWERLFNVTTRPGETIPRLIHQTWKDSQLPDQWRKSWKECREGMPDYEYMLWTDDLARHFVETLYPTFLQTFDSYKYPIQRADAIRYFVLNQFGGIYMDLDIGCRRRIDSLLQGDWDVILPITKPVGVSNDLILSSKGSAFMENTVHALPAFNHEWFSNYPTVMFSTGPMFLSAQYAVYSSAHPLTDSQPRTQVRILPKSLYGKNAPAISVPHSFFSHFYGSSWHDKDSGFIAFLGTWGKILMYVGAVIILVTVIRLAYVKWTGGSSQQYHILPMSASGSHSGSTTPTTGSSGSAPLSPSWVVCQTSLRFVPALFRPGATRPARGRTSSESSAIPLRRGNSRSCRDLDLDHVDPPPYDDPQVGRKDKALEEVDAFLKDEGVTAASGSTEGRAGKEAEWAEWAKDSSR